jgi:hypothetical protein
MNLQTTPTECRERTHKILDLIENKELMGWEWGCVGGGWSKHIYQQLLKKSYIKSWTPFPELLCSEWLLPPKLHFRIKVGFSELRVQVKDFKQGLISTVKFVTDLKFLFIIYFSITQNLCFTTNNVTKQDTLFEIGIIRSTWNINHLASSERNS